MTGQEIEDFIIKKIEEIAFSKAGVSDPLLSSGILDSVNVVELSVEIELFLGIKIPFEDINEANFQTVQTITSYIKNLGVH